MTSPLCMLDFGYRDGEHRCALRARFDALRGIEQGTCGMFAKEFAAIRKCLKRIDHGDNLERDIGLKAEAALELIERHLMTQMEAKNN